MTSRPHTSEDAPPIWETLHAHHQELLSCIEAHRELCLADVPNRAALASSRWRVADAGRRRMLYLNGTVFPAAEAACHGADPSLVIALRDATPAYQRHVSAYVTRWTTDAIVADWETYRHAAYPFRETILTRISQEAAVLRPILRRGAMVLRDAR